MSHDNQHTEHEIARLRREHAAMVAFIKRCKSIPRRSNEGLDELYQQACTLLYEIENTAIAIATPDTPPAGVTGSGGRYIPKRHETSKFRYCVWDTETETAIQIASERFIWTTLPRVKRECQRLNGVTV